jgi:hypothetical protein
MGHALRVLILYGLWFGIIYLDGMFVLEAISQIEPAFSLKFEPLVALSLGWLVLSSNPTPGSK